MGRIIVGVDGSERSQRALEWAIDYARRRRDLGEDLTVTPVRAYLPPPVRSPYTYSYSDRAASVSEKLREPERIWREEYDEHFRTEAEASLAEALSSLSELPDGSMVRPQVLRGDAAEVLIRLSREVDVELLALGSRGQGGFTGLLLGSVSLKCLHHAACPVLIVR
jgi:nucleotide-binding universal stress UspA family protein